MPDPVGAADAGAVTWHGLLRRAAALYDDPGTGLARTAGRAAWGGFRSGAAWMRQALGVIRGELQAGRPSVAGVCDPGLVNVAGIPAGSGLTEAGHRRGPPTGPPAVNFHVLGAAKYGARRPPPAGAAAAVWAGVPALAALAVPLFYAVEVQTVFLFPLALDGDPRPFRSARRWTRRAGGTLRAMAVVMPVAATMLGGGFVGRGFVRSWCLGCLAVCVWYDRLRVAHSTPAG